MNEIIHCMDYSGYQSHAPFSDFFPFQKLSFGGRQSNVSMTIVVFISCHFHGNVRSSLDQVYSLSYYDKVICNFAEMEGYYEEKTWSVTSCLRSKPIVIVLLRC